MIQISINIVWAVVIILLALWFQGIPLLSLLPVSTEGFHPHPNGGGGGCGNIDKDRDLTVEYRGCSTPSVAHQICHNLAKDNCRIPTWQLNDCWLKTYQKCANSCGSGNPVSCGCHAYASELCRSEDDPAEKCYADVHQECLAGMGYAPDPDRGINKGVPDCGCR